MYMKKQSSLHTVPLNDHTALNSVNNAKLYADDGQCTQSNNAGSHHLNNAGAAEASLVEQ